MNYNRQNFDLINEATQEASIAINIAYSLISVFYENYLDTVDGARALAFDAENRFTLLEVQMRGIFEMICKTKKQLDVFSYSESDMLNSHIEKALEIQKIIEFKNKW